MSITDELRKWLKSLYTPNSGAVKDEGERIADRIDAAHEEALSQAYMDVSDSEWIRLPKDADGEYIHIGDKLIDEDDKLQKPAIVKCILYNDEGCVVSDIDPRGCWYNPSILRHYHAPTVEDVLREFANEVYADADNEIRDRDFLCAKYAKRLTLAEKEDA